METTIFPYNLAPVDLFSTSLTLTASAILPCGVKAHIAMVGVAGRIGAEQPSERDLWAIRHAARDLVDEAGEIRRYYARNNQAGLIVDLRQLSPPVPLDPGFHPSWMEEPEGRVRILVSPDAERTVLGELPPGTVTTDLTEAIREITAHYVALVEARDWYDTPVKLAEEDWEDHLDHPDFMDLTSLLRHDDASSPLTAEYYRITGDGIGQPIGLMRIVGTYADGSAGTGDAKLISKRIERFCRELEPGALIIDLRDFHYSYGDDLELHPFPDHSMAGLRFVVAPSALETFTLPVERDLVDTDVLAALRALGHIPHA